MQSVLGIDAAWTLKQPSGVALVANKDGRWRLVIASPSYGHFLHSGDVGLAVGARPVGSKPDPKPLLEAAFNLCGVAPAVVAIDMPLSFDPIVGRRAADNAVSREYGARKCGTHSPSIDRPGRISDDLREGFEGTGYRLRTVSFSAPALIEVYPHPALVELTEASERLPYKAAKVRAYWRELQPQQRRLRLLKQWHTIVAALEDEIDGVADNLPVPTPASSGVELKAFEDMLDAVVCAWVGVSTLRGRAVAFGDSNAAIWIPVKGPWGAALTLREENNRWPEISPG